MQEDLDSRDRALVIAGCALYSAGGLVFTVTPIYLGNVAEKFGASPETLGALSALELWAMALISLTGPLWIARIDWRTLVRVGAVVSLVGQLVSLGVTDLRLLMVVRAATGLLGEGLLLAMAYLLLGQTRNVARSFGWAYGVSIAISMLILYNSPAIDRLTGTIGVLVMLAVLAGAALLASFVVPRAIAPTTAVVASPSAGRSGDLAVGALMLGGQMAWFGGAAGFWSFVEQIASSNGLKTSQLAPAIAIGVGAGLIGSLIALVLSDRIGRVVPASVSTALMAVVLWPFLSTADASAVTLQLALFNVFWASGTIYNNAIACAVDRNGRIAVGLSAFQTIGMALGTFVLGHTIAGLGVGAAGWTAAAFLAAGLLLLVLGNRWGQARGLDAARTPDFAISE